MPPMYNICDMFDAPSTDDSQGEIVGLELSQENLFPFSSIEDFNNREVGAFDLGKTENEEEPFFGENIRETKKVLKAFFQK